MRLTALLDKSHAAASEVASTFGTEATAPATEQILAELAKQDATKRNEAFHRSISANGAPLLREPDAALLLAADERAAERGGAGFMTWVAASMQQLLERQSMDAMHAKVTSLLQRLVGKESSAAQLSADYQAASEAYDQALGQAGEAAGEANEAVAAAKAAKEEVARLQKELEAMSPGSPGYDATQQQLAAATATADGLQAKADAAVSRSDAAARSAAEIGAGLQAIRQEAGKLGVPVVQSGDASRTMAARLTELMAILQQLLGYAREANMQAAAEAAVQALKAQEAEMTHLAEERAEELAKAESTSKWLGCIGKIIGWVVTVVSVVAAPFTGGLSMALAGVGLALAVVEETTGFSLLGEALQPVIQLVVKLAQELTKVFGSLLESMGIHGADTIAQVMGFIATALAVAAVAIGGFLLAKGAMAKLLPNIVKQVAGEVSKEATRITAKVATSVVGKQAGAFMSRNAGTIGAVAVAAGGVTQVGTAVGGVVVADMHVTATELLADQKNVQFNMGQTNITLEALQEMISELEEVIASIVKSMEDAMVSRRSAAKFMVANIGSM
jgi:invasin B